MREGGNSDKKSSSRDDKDDDDDDVVSLAKAVMCSFIRALSTMAMSESGWSESRKPSSSDREG